MAMQVPNPYAVGAAVGGPRNVSQGLVAAPDVPSSKYNEADRLQQAGGEFGKSLDQWQKEIDATRAQDAANQLNEAALKLKYGDGTGQNGWVNQLGKNALERESGKSLEQENLEELRTQADGIRKTLGTARQRKLFDDIFEATRVQMSQGIASHTQKQFKVYQDSVDLQSMETAFKSAKSSDPETQRSGLEVSRALIQKIYARRGLDPDYSKGPGIIHGMLIDDMVDSGNASRASAYLQANKGEMSAEQVEAAERVVKAGEEIEEVDATARSILGGTKSLHEALSAVNGVDARIRTKVRTQVRQAYADVESAMKAENQANKKLAWQQLQTQGKIEPTLRAEMFEKDPEALARLDNYAEKQAGGGLKYSDQTVLAGIERLADSDPEEFKRLDILEDFGDKLRAEDIRALQKKQRNIDVEEHKDFLAAVKSAAKVEGVRTADIPKVSLAAEKKWNAWIEGHGGKVPTADEQKRMVETLFRGEDVGLLWNSDLPQWRAIVDNPNTPVSDLASIGWRPTVDDAALSQYAIKELGVVPPESWSGKQREAVVSLYSGNGWPTEIWAEAQKRCAEIQRRRRAEGKPERPLTNAVIEAMAKAMIFEGVK